MRTSVFVLEEVVGQQLCRPTNLVDIEVEDFKAESAPRYQSTASC